MKVKITTCMVGTDFVRHVGDICEVDAEEGKRLIAAGFAENAKEAKAKTTRKKNYETAATR